MNEFFRVLHRFWYVEGLAKDTHPWTQEYREDDPLSQGKFFLLLKTRGCVLPAPCQAPERP